mmetsp:Transcript_13906/g.40095  ORF Transcript_13906/g.40095 Transcript_13906/m.40095 type:complete len:434 (+) Transcript_13906:149-1450(+)
MATGGAEAPVERVLSRNPDGCTIFESNAFKKERCKHCGRGWTEHDGVISENLLQNFMSAAAKVAGAKQKAEDEAKQKAKSRTQSKRQQRAVEDEWYYEGANQESSRTQDESDEEDGGFRMITPVAEPKRQPSPEGAKPLKVVNLIDFGECDKMDEDRASPGLPGASASSPELVPGGVSSPLADLDDVVTRRRSAPSFAGVGIGADGVAHHDLVAEIQHLRQMLADANEEKTIQVAIVRDEVAEKQRLVEELVRQREEAEGKLRAAREQLEGIRAERTTATGEAASEDAHPPLGGVAMQEVERLRADAERWRREVDDLRAAASEADGMRSRVAELERELELSRAAVATAEAKAAVARAEVEKERSAPSRSPAAAASPQFDAFSGLAEADAVGDLAVRKATQAFREIKMNAEKQMAWLSMHIREKQFDLETPNIE